MNKLVLLILALGLVSCNHKDEQYYRSNPKALQDAVQACPKQTPQGLSCQQLEQLGQRMAQMAYRLQYSPQAFGQSILALQESIHQQEAKLNSDAATPELKASLVQNKQQLADALAVVKWLESPEG